MLTSTPTIRAILTKTCNPHRSLLRRPPRSAASPAAAAGASSLWSGCAAGAPISSGPHVLELPVRQLLPERARASPRAPHPGRASPFGGSARRNPGRSPALTKLPGASAHAAAGG